MNKDLQKALYISWFILSILSGLLLIAPFIIPENFLLTQTNICWAKAKGSSCWMCGMTRAFLAISKGEFIHAHNLNSKSIYLFFLLIGNFLSLSITNLITLKK